MSVTAARPSSYVNRDPERSMAAVDLLRLPLVGRVLRWRGVRLALQLPLFLLAAILIAHGLYGSELAPKNLATLVTWVHYRGLLVLILLVAGNFFCLACPFLLPRELARRFFRPGLSWPRPLRNKWLAVVLFISVLFAYELFGLWGAPRWTAWLILGYFAAALAVDVFFKHAPFCKWLCPIGQFSFVSSAMSPLEVKVRHLEICGTCKTKDCIRGEQTVLVMSERLSGKGSDPLPSPMYLAEAIGKTGGLTPFRTASEPAGAAPGRLSLPVVAQRGCELALFQPMKVGNMDCTFCLDCVHACPHDNVGVMTRLPGSELWIDGTRSGLGEPLKRQDMAALVVVFTFGALLNAFGMVSPVYAVQAWLSRLLGTTERAPILALLFLVMLVIEPVVLLGLAAWLMRRATGTRESLLRLATRYAFTLVPLGFGVWLAHYAFHFFTGVLTIVPVAQNAVAELGSPVLGEPNWGLGGMRPGPVYLLELGMLGLGLIGSWIVAGRLARTDHPNAPCRAFLPWAILHAVLWASAVWLLAQPMEMRGTFLGG